MTASRDEEPHKEPQIMTGRDEPMNWPCDNKRKAMKLAQTVNLVVRTFISTFTGGTTIVGH
jgi:hypothetical protein